jgi:hypothetical protein
MVTVFLNEIFDRLIEMPDGLEVTVSKAHKTIDRKEVEHNRKGERE